MTTFPTLFLTLAATATPALAAPQAIGDLVQGPGGEYFLLDPHQGGQATDWTMRRMMYGRLVDVHAIDASGDVLPDPILRDLVIHPDIASDGVDYELLESPITQKTRLVILRPFTGAGSGADPFVALLQQAQASLPVIEPKSDDPATLPPFTMLPRNAAVVLMMDDLLDDSATEELRLFETVSVSASYPPSIPYASLRPFFATTHGGTVPSTTGGFHATRVVLDLTVSQAEAAAMTVPTAINALGLPASEASSSLPNVSVRIPTKTDAGSGQFHVIQNLGGFPVTPGGPVDLTTSTQDMVRAMRSGNGEDQHKGFLTDVHAPRIIGTWQASIDAAISDPVGTPGLDFLVTLRFPTVCQSAPRAGDVIEVPGLFLEVTQDARPPDPAGVVHRVHVRSVSGATTPAALVGAGSYLLPYKSGLLDASNGACWLSITPLPGTAPATDVDPNSQVGIRFSEPMAPESVSPYDTFALSRVMGLPTAHETVPAEVLAAGDLVSFTLTPLLPLSHEQGTAESYHVWLGGSADTMTDLAGNPVTQKPVLVPLAIDANAPTDKNGGIVMRFSDLDEVKEPAAADGADDLRGQFLFDRDAGVVRPRPVTRFAGVADRTQPIPAVMIPFPVGVNTPLTPLGSKMMSVWRYADFSWSSSDETQHNVDVEGLSWAPLGGQVIADVYPEFEMRLSHSHYLPEENLSQFTLLPEHPQSGLQKSTFDANILSDPESPQKVVHPRALGYAIDPSDVFLSTTGTAMIPWPMNQQGGPYESYLWRDTAVQAEAGPNGAGIEMKIQETLGLIPPGTQGAVAGPGQVPSIGLPLLMEFRTYPSATSVGLNALDTSLAINTSRLPSFRVYSAGGINSSGIAVTKDPDLEQVPSGGFNPASTPPGAATVPDDNVYYMGQLDLVTRVSRAHTIWLDTGVADSSTSFLSPQVLPAPQDQPAGTEIVVAWRGAISIVGSGQTDAFDADLIDPYGAVRGGIGEYLGEDGDIVFFPILSDTWKSDIATLDSSRYVQARVTFISNVTSLEAAEMSSLAIAFDHQ